MELWEHGEHPAYIGVICDNYYNKEYDGDHGWSPYSILQHYYHW